MGDLNTHADQGADAVDTSNHAPDTDVTADDADTAQNTDANDDTGVSEDGADADGAGDSDASSDNADDTDADDGSEPEVRKPKVGASNAEWAAWRAHQKAKKADESGDDSQKGDGDADEDDDTTPEAELIDKRIQKHLEPLQQQAAENEVEASIAEFVKDNPDFAPFSQKVKRFALHPSRQNIPVKSIFYEVAGDKLLQIGAKRAKAADTKAKHSQTGGGNAGTETGNKSYKDMPFEDFGKELDAVKTGRR